MSVFAPFSGRSVALLGFGRSCAPLLPDLLRCGARVHIRDARQDLPLPSPLPEGVRVTCGPTYLNDLREDFLFRSPGLRPDLPPIAAAVARGAILTGEYDLFAAHCPAPLLGVTGSDGKTTTTTLAGLLLEAGMPEAQVFVGGNIGTPLLPRLSAMGPKDVVVAELSSFQLMTAPSPPRRAVITNITENHLNWHRDMAEYRAAKCHILGEHTHAVLSADGEETWALASKRRGDCTLFSTRKDHRTLQTMYGAQHTVTVEKDRVLYDGEDLLPRSDIRVPGEHNLQNALAAIGLVYPLCTRRDALGAALHRFAGVPHRLERVGVVRGVTYYNSSIDSTPTRTAAALSALPHCAILLCGGRGKNLSFAPLLAAVRAHVGRVIAFGEARADIVAALATAEISCLCETRMEDAVHLARGLAKPGDTVLLSPACTSFDAYTDFAERGNAFRHLIEGYIKEEEN